MRRVLFAVFFVACATPPGLNWAASPPAGAREMTAEERRIVAAAVEAWRADETLPEPGRRASRLPLIYEGDDALAQCWIPGDEGSAACHRSSNRRTHWIVVSPGHPLLERAIAHEAVHWLRDVTGHDQVPSIRDAACWGSEEDPYCYHRDPRLWTCSTFGFDRAPPGCDASVEARARAALGLPRGVR